MLTGRTDDLQSLIKINDGVVIIMSLDEAFEFVKTCLTGRELGQNWMPFRILVNEMRFERIRMRRLERED
jgi:hypothetical protein